jgi:DNA-binding NtrC family response regulator
VAGAAACERDRALYQDACLRHCREAIAPRLAEVAGGRAPAERLVPLFRELSGEHARLLGFAGSPLRPPPPEHVFAMALQRLRAHHHLTSSIIGSSRPAAELRAGVWCSIFTHDLRAYESDLYESLDEVPTLITGPTGTGKELVARTIAHSRYVPCDSRGRLAAPGEAPYHPVNLAAMSSSLIESELFGHARGAFTGATEERPGFFDCGAGETLLLDEIGEIDLPLQVKLLRVLQTRRFFPVGSRKERPLSARLLCATHRDLAARVEEGAFRQDLFYRICADWITTPSLRAQLDDCPGDRPLLVRFIADRMAGPTRGEALALRTDRWIESHLPARYPWPGNVRELEVCVRSVMMRGTYTPARAGAGDGCDPLRDVRALTLSLSDLVRRYTTAVYAETGNISETARRLGVERQAVRGKIDRELLERMRGGR